ncbi:acetoin utilization protein [Thioclava sp. SK-1]|uniref:class II histone deacetylase n=1 Tax=Thioclava sp. SK-1 TaxID=1889770 RepID=UPI000824C36A|nr:class II histone deacetylase [Thioclava sp. SK-1]OCX66924.1 acetoin utilization protein [Thioclava sp. SK-1]
MQTGFFHDERSFWHGGGNYALTLPVGGFVQPGGGLPESPETKRRLVNLLRVSGLMAQIDAGSAPEASYADLNRVHPASYLDVFKATSDAGGGELGLRTPFMKGGYELAALSAGLAVQALSQVMTGRYRNSYSLSRPPGHHALPDFPNGFCLINNIAVAIRAAQAAGQGQRFAVVDWDVHHGNGTEAVFLDDPDVLTISLHQEHNYPLETGDVDIRGAQNSNINIPLPPGTGQVSYLEAWDKIVAPALARHQPDGIIIACGYDAGICDPIAQMVLGVESYQLLTQRAMQAADALCEGRLMVTHEGGYSEAYVPFCGHAVLSEMSGSKISVPDPLAQNLRTRQPKSRWIAHTSEYLDELVRYFGF